MTLIQIEQISFFALSLWDVECTFMWGKGHLKQFSIRLQH